MTTKISRNAAKAVYYNPFIKKVVTPEFYNNSCDLQGMREQYIFFASKLELRTYQMLVDNFGIARVYRQYPIQLFEKGLCYPKGLFWRVDFVVLRDTSRWNFIDPFPIQYLVESKGIVERAFRYQLTALESYQPELFEKLYVVFGSSFPSIDIIKNLQRSTVKDRILSFNDAVSKFKLFSLQESCSTNRKKYSRQQQMKNKSLT
jgi:hypothetical protein